MDNQNKEEIVNKLNPLELKSAVEYQPASVVSRQILKKPNGNLTLFAFDTDENLSEHTSPYEAVVQMVDGEMEITIGGKPFNVKAGEYLILPAGIPHALKALRPAKMLLSMIK